jgi:DNA-binding cell septation regulator SpoVG
MHIDLLREELMKRLDQVLVKIKVIVSHFLGHHEVGLAHAFVVELLRVIPGDQGVLLPVDYEGRTPDLRHKL